MSSWELKIITAEAERLLPMAGEDADLRAGLRALAESILAATEGPNPLPDVARDDRPPGPEPLKELTLGRTRPSTGPVEVPDVSGAAGPDDDPEGIEGRCRRKAEAARLAASRLRQEVPPGETAPDDPEAATWADRFTDCYYWRNKPDTSQPAGVAPLDDVGGCFEAVAEALALLTGRGQGRRVAVERALPLMAEAQSALRRALQRLQAPDDPDQLAAYGFVRESAARHRVYLKRYMRADDLADPARWPDLLARIDALGGGDPQARRHCPLLEKVRRLVSAVREGHGGEADWQAVIESVDAAVGAGLPPSNREVRDLLLPVIENLPERDDLPQGFRLVLRETDRFLAARTSQPAPGEPASQQPTAEVKDARRLLAGRSAVLIGGACRPDAHKALESALGLKELIWVETKEHQSVETFEPAVAGAGVAVVLLAIRWSSHAFGDVKRFCDRHGKPLVRLPGGYGPNQVAAQILAQCSDRLGGERSGHDG
jgi:hypothetical protein